MNLISALFPDLSLLKQITTPDPMTGDGISAIFVVFIWGLTSLFFIYLLYNAVLAYLRIKWLEKHIKGLTLSNAIEKRETLYKKALAEKKHPTAHLWKEFDESLVETHDAGKTKLSNTIDAYHFFNTQTLAGSLTESRFLAAVPGFLTAMGVICTFIGLQIGLSQLNIGSDVDVKTMKEGLAEVISGASIAFLTSVWGVFLSVCFNFFEKIFEGRARKRIARLQNNLDSIFPRISAESQLEQIMHDGRASRETLQGLAEQIGDRLQDTLIQATQGIREGLEASMERIMGPAINRLVDETSNNGQHAMENLVGNFMEKFGEQGIQQRLAMEKASSQMSEVLTSLSNTMTSFVSKLEHSSNESSNRDRNLMTTISVQINQLLEHSQEQKKIMTEFVKEQLTGLKTQLQAQNAEAIANDTRRQEAFSNQTIALQNSTQELLYRIESSQAAQMNASEKILAQGQTLQMGIEASTKASAAATGSMLESSTQLRAASDKMSVMSSHIRDAGNQLSGSITHAVESTKDLAEQNQSSIQLIQQLRASILEDQNHLKSITETLQNIITTSGNAFVSMKNHQDEFLAGLNTHVEQLNSNMQKSLEDYASRANGQTAEHLKIWAQSTTEYSAAMTNTVNTLSNIVDEIDVKIGR